MLGIRTLGCLGLLVSFAVLNAAGLPGDPGHLGVLFVPDTAELSSEIEGTVETVHVHLGDVVDQGAVLVTLASEGFPAELDQARARLEVARSGVESAEAELADVRRVLKRRRAATDLFSDEEIETLELEERKARAAWAAANSTTVEREAFVRELERRIGALRLRAPFAGEIAACYPVIGERIRPGQELIRLLGRGELWVRFAVPSSDSDWLRPGADVRVEVEADREWAGEIRQVAPEVDSATDMIFAEAVLGLSAAEGEPAVGDVVRVRPATP